MDFIKSLLISIFDEQVEDLNRFAADKTHKLLVLSFAKQISAFLFSTSFIGISLTLSLYYGTQTLDANVTSALLWTLGPIFFISAIIIKGVVNKRKIETIFESKKIRHQSAVNVLEIVEAVRQIKETFSSPTTTHTQADKKFNDIDNTLVSVADAITALNNKIEDQQKTNHFSSFQ